jgi:hypothetical protein
VVTDAATEAALLMLLRAVERRLGLSWMHSSG